MAEALREFIKVAVESYGIYAPKFFAVYDSKVESSTLSTAKSSCSRRLRHYSLNKLKEEMLSGTCYGSIVELIRDRTERNTYIARVIEREGEIALSAANAELGLLARSGDVCARVCLLKPLESPDFRDKLTKAFETDCLDIDLEGFWSMVDSTIDAALRSTSNFIKSDVIAFQRKLIEMFMIACLEGARAFRQEVGVALDGTVPPFDVRPSAKTRKRGAFQLQAVIFSGMNIWDYCSDFGGAMASGETAARIFSVDSLMGARIGRDDAEWCGAAGRSPVLTSARGVSRRHCEIFPVEGGWMIRDGDEDGKGSSGGTLICRGDKGASDAFLRGDSAPLYPGDFICLAPDELDGGRLHVWQRGARGVCFRFEAVPILS